MPEPPDEKPPHRKQVERRRAVRGPTGTGQKGGADNMEKGGAGSRGTGGTGSRGTGADSKRTDGRGQHGDGRRQHGNGRCVEAPTPKTKTRSAEAERVIGTVGSPTPGGRSGGTERQPFLIEAISWAGVACR